MAIAASAAMSVTKSAAALPMKKSADFRRGSSSSGVATIRASASVEKSGGGGGGSGSNAGGGCNSISSNGGGGGGEGKKGVPNNSKYVVPLVEKATAGLTRPLAEILRDLNKRVPDKIINQDDSTIPWYHANRMLSFYAPGWCGEIRNVIYTGEIRNVIYTDNRSVMVLYRLTIRGSDGEAHRESTGTVSVDDVRFEDPVAAAEELAFCRACARFGFGLYLYHEDETM